MAAKDVQYAQVTAKVGSAGQPGFRKAQMLRVTAGSAAHDILKGVGITTKTNLDQEDEEVVSRNRLLSEGKVAGLRVLAAGRATASGRIQTLRYTGFVPIAKYEEAFALLPSKTVKGRNVSAVQGLRK